METIEMPMTSGVATTVRPTVTTMPDDLGGKEYSSSIVESCFVPSDYEYTADENEAGVNTADQILESAKDEGFEMTLKDLADGKFEEPEEEAIEGDKKISEEETVLEEIVSEDKVDPALEKFEVFKKQFEGLNEELKGMQERVSKIEDNYLSKEALLEAMLIIAELKKSEDEEEQLSLFELLVKAMARVLTDLAPDEEQQKVNGQEQNKSPKKKGRSINEIRQELIAKGLIRRSPVENQAA